jgi:hypothetical protein
LAIAIKEHPEDMDILSVTCASDQGCARIYHSRIVTGTGGSGR